MKKTKNIISFVIAFLLIAMFSGSCGRTSTKIVTDDSPAFQNVGKNSVSNQGYIPQQNYIPRSLSNHFAVDEKVYWATEPERGIVKSVDAGKTWSVLSLDKTAKLSQLFKYSSLDIFFVDDLRGWITGNLQTWKTQDGGENWEQIFDGQIDAISFYNQKIGWMNIADEKKSRNYKTQDGGETWEPCSQITEEIRFKKGTFFISPQIGWAFINKNKADSIISIAKTQDGGCHWQEIWKGVDNTDIRYADLFFINEKVGWFSTLVDNGLFQTQDGGKTWKNVSIPNHSAQIETFFFKNEKEGWILFASSPENPLLYKTSDNGINWSLASKEYFYQSYQTDVSFPRVSQGLRRAIVIQSFR